MIILKTFSKLEIRSVSFILFVYLHAASSNSLSEQNKAPKRDRNTTTAKTVDKRILFSFQIQSYLRGHYDSFLTSKFYTTVESDISFTSLARTLIFFVITNVTDRSDERQNWPMKLV